MAQQGVQKEIIEMRDLGKRIFQSVGSGMDLRLEGVKILRIGSDVTASPRFKFLRAEEVEYTARNPFTGNSVSETWIRAMNGRGVTILPLVTYEGEEHPVLILKPQPSVASWSIELISGGVKDDTDPQTIAEKELQQETGLKAGKTIIMKQLANVWHAPHRLNTTDTMVIARDLTFVGGSSTESEENPISGFIASWPEVMTYLSNNTIKYSISIAAISTYLLWEAPPSIRYDIEKARQRI